MVERVFTLEDQKTFANLSGDYNRLHLDEIAARRLLFGGLVVHGIHLVLWALDQWLEFSEDSLEFVSLKVTFWKHLRVGEHVSCNFINQEKNQLKLELYADGDLLVSVKGEYKRPLAPAEDSLDSKFPAGSNCKVLLSEDIKGANGELEICIEKDTAKLLVPNAVKKLPLMQIAQVLATTRLVGMECPGLHSIYVGFDVGFDRLEKDSRVLRYHVARFNSRLSSLVMNVEGPSMRGKVTAFLRPAEVQQRSFSELREFVAPDEFRNQRALIIGGSRGLGELACKILAAGGAETFLTFVKGREDASRVVAEINSHGGQADCSYFDILDPGKAKIDAVGKFSPTHLYYFATPRIAATRGSFSEKLFKELCDFYVVGFANALEFLLKIAPGLGKVFYPSSIFVEQKPALLAEYVAAKAAGEDTCSNFEKRKENLIIYRPRLPKMTTDQTASLLLNESNDPLPVMLKECRYFSSIPARTLAFHPSVREQG